MAKLGKRKISVSSSIDHTQRLGFEVEVNVSKENVYIWFSGISAFMYGVGLFAAIREVISKYIKRK